MDPAAVSTKCGASTNFASGVGLADEKGPYPWTLQHGFGDEHWLHPIVTRLDQSFQLSG